MSPNARISAIKKRGLCMNCLSANHSERICKSSNCRTCNKRHNSLLHLEDLSLDLEDNRDITHQSTSSNNETAITMHSIKTNDLILLSTALVFVPDKHGYLHKFRALLDNGSQSNFVTKKVCDQLGLEKQKVNFAISGVGQSLQSISNQVTISITSINKQYHTQVKCLVINKITEKLPKQSFNKRHLNIPSDVTLADEKFNETGPIDILLGAAIFWEIINKNTIKLGRDNPVLQDTKLGWIVGGNITNDSKAIKNNLTQEITICTNIEHNLDDLISKFWNLEECSSVKNHLSISEKHCEQHFSKTHRRNDKSGKFVVNIPFNDNLELLGDSRQIALSRFRAMERKLELNQELKIQYHQFMQDYLNLGHMSEFDDTVVEKQGYYLPHHPIIKNNSITTKLRVVFDASAKTTSGYSLNDVQYTGPNLQNDLMAILLRFRQYTYVITADISKMYRNILVNHDHRRFQKIFWRFNTNEAIKCYKLNTVTYGTSSAPFLAMRSLRQVATEIKSSFPQISDIISNDFYMDDLLTGSDNLNELISIQNDTYDILARYGFELRQWLSNNPNSYDQFRTNHKLEANILQLGENECNKTLGMLWNACNDSIQFSINDNLNNQISKRTILSTTCQIFDPLGLLGPIIIISKIIIQKLWQLKLEWDQPIPNSISTDWVKFRSELSVLNTLNIARHVVIPDALSIEMHGFADASEKAYGLFM
ncbi:uncharacterized protein LOC116176246 [Photinus pyralis]|uniref:uncharacterized protein LOC116176246 n=1 Tax=Photinus pyralis TaxID=7054 RepID=UPI0012676E27|nr:uncharacterized protein LOC116176246 [Photinus pyralis]